MEDVIREVAPELVKKVRQIAQKLFANLKLGIHGKTGLAKLV